MVKGVSRRVIVVKSPDTRFFEQAIFIVKEEALLQKGVTPEQIMEEACRVADGYVRKNIKGGRISGWKVPVSLYVAAGAAATAAAWLLTFLVWG